MLGQTIPGLRQGFMGLPEKIRGGGTSTQDDQQVLQRTNTSPQLLHDIQEREFYPNGLLK